MTISTPEHLVATTGRGKRKILQNILSKLETYKGWFLFDHNCCLYFWISQIFVKTNSDN